MLVIAGIAIDCSVGVAAGFQKLGADSSDGLELLGLLWSYCRGK